MTMNRLCAVLCAAMLLAACNSDDGTPEPTSGMGVPSTPIPAPNPAPNPPPPPPATNDKTPQPTAVGTPIGQSVSKTIGTGGGELSSVDGAIAVVVPAGALARDETVSIQEITNEAHGAKGRAFRISPEGLNTPVPMTVRYRYNDETLAGTTLPSLAIAYQDAAHAWHVYTKPSVDANAKTLSIETRHFSDWSLISGIQIIPNTARVTIGQSLNLRVLVCESEPVDADGELRVPMPDELIACEASPLQSFAVSRWSVNSTEGGSATFGTVVADPNRSSGQAAFTAPATKPTPNVVSVSARYASLDDPTSFQLLVANITIDEEAANCEAFKSIERFSAELSFDQFSFTGIGENRRHDGRHSGRLIGTLQRTVSAPTNFGLWVTYLQPLEGGYVTINDTFSYQPPDGDGYTGSFTGSGAPHEGLDAPSFIGLKIYYDTCTFDLFGSFVVDSTVVRKDAISDTKLGIGGISIFGHAITPSAASPNQLQGTLTLPATSTNSITGYAPVHETAADWTFAGSTTARWTMTPQL